MASFRRPAVHIPIEIGQMIFLTAIGLEFVPIQRSKRGSQPVGCYSNGRRLQRRGYRDPRRPSCYCTRFHSDGARLHPSRRVEGCVERRPYDGRHGRNRGTGGEKQLIGTVGVCLTVASCHWAKSRSPVLGWPKVNSFVCSGVASPSFIKKEAQTVARAPPNEWPMTWTVFGEKKGKELPKHRSPDEGISGS